jgi:cytoskeletal protein CcmA (bactofilin family)
MFGKKKKQYQPRFVTVIGAGTVMQGDVQFRDGLHIEGEVQGNVLADPADPHATLVVALTGRIRGNIQVPNVVLYGQVQGDVFATDSLVLKAAVKVEGNLHYSFLDMTAGAEVNGQLLRDQSDKLEASAQKLSGPGASIPPLEHS